MTPEMSSYEDSKRTYKARELYVLSDKIEELHRTKEELKQAKDEAMQSWLDSRPLIDELEKLQSELANAKKQSENDIVTKLESELMAINMSIRVKKEEELKATNDINEMTRVSESIREEMERLKLEISEGRRARSKKKMVIKMRRQTLRTLKLTLRAVRLESEAYGASAESALEQINHARVSDHGATIELTEEDYFALTRRAKEETSLADWRVVVANEQRLVAEESRDLALKDPTLEGGSMKNNKAGEISNNKEGDISGNGVKSFRLRARTPFPKGRANQIANDGTKGNKNQMQVGKKKPSIFIEIKSFFARKIKYLFG
ncbi:hypothetical protein Tco_0362844 [Tanacetum coccineum]